jgi:hypothetical protein
VQRGPAGEPLINAGSAAGPALDGGELPPAARPSLPALPLDELELDDQERWSEAPAPVQREATTARPPDTVLRLPVVQAATGVPTSLTGRPAEPSAPLPLVAPVLQREVPVETATPMPVLQRQPDLAATPLEGTAQLAEAFPAVQRQEAGGAPASPPAAGAGGGHSELELDDLARQLYDRFRIRFRSELLIDRERAGMLVDRR